MIELDPVDRLTTGAIGEPGKRVFYLQARQDDRLVTILVEKQQVELLSASLVEVLARAGRETGEGPSEEEMDLEEPVVPEWRAGRISIGYDEDRDMILLEAEEVSEEESEEEEVVSTGDRGQVRLWASREQALALARHGAAVAAAGRPRCQLCGNPIDPEGHVCPALNGQHA
jgi:uncharacterized repeat protein (TIGR03847 family)